MNRKGLIFIRNGNFQFDSRLQRAANTALKLGIQVIVLSWIRDNSRNHPKVFQLANGCVEMKYYYKVSPFGKGIKNIFNLIQFNRWICCQLIKLEHAYDMIHACDLDVSLPAYVISRLRKKIIVYDIFDYYAHSHVMPRYLKIMVEFLENKLISMVDVVIVCNEQRLSQIEKARPKDCIVIYNTPDLSNVRFAPALIKEDKPVFKIAYVGTLCREGRLLVEIVEQVSRYKHIAIHIAGIGPLAEYFAKKTQEHDNIYFYGQISIEQALQLEAECSLLFATYDPAIDINKYSAPNKVSEAMAFRKPIIVCRNTGSDTVVKKHDMGLVIDYDADEFWKAVTFLADNKEVCDKMGHNARKAYDEFYSWEKMDGRLARLYSSLIISGSGRHVNGRAAAS